MSGLGKSAKPVRQLSLQPPAPRRQQIRRQRSAEDDKTLQICASPLARGKRGTKSGSERPKVRVAWSENRRKSEKGFEQVEVVARQIPGRSRPITGKSRGLIGIEKPPILYSRQELAERLRLAWKHREENKANINIFLAHRTVEERCDSEMSSDTTITAPPSAVSRKDTFESEFSTNREIAADEQTDETEISMRLNGDNLENETEDVRIKKAEIVLSGNDETREKKSDGCEVFYSDTERTAGEGGTYGDIRTKEREKSEPKDEKSVEQIQNSTVDECSNSKKRVSVSIDCSRAPSTTLPSIKIENMTQKASKEDYSSAKQKRASFRSGTNRAFLEPIKSPATEFRGNSVDRVVPQKPTSVESKDVIANDKSVATKSLSEFKSISIIEKSVCQKVSVDNKSNCTIDKSSRTKSVVENKETLAENRAINQKANEGGKSNSTIKRNGTASVIAENKDLAVDKSVSVKNTEVRCSSVNERNVPSRKATEAQKIDQKSRRTSSAPPQRHLANAAASNNRVQVNIVIDAPSTGKNDSRDDQEKTADKDRKINATEQADMASIKASSGRSVRSAPLKRRSRSAKRRFWGSCKNEEDGKSRNRSGGRGKSSVDSRTIDIVTMVSLVSSADSDSDIETSPGDDKLINELRSKLPTTSIIKTSMNPVLSIARKPIKSVSFQRDSFDEDSSKEQQPPPKEEKKTAQARLAIVNNAGNGGSLSSSEETATWRTDISGLALPIMAMIHDVEETIDVPLTDREKRCLAVPIGELHDKKRKLLKTRSTISRSEVEKQITSPKTNVQKSPRILSLKPEISLQQIKPPNEQSPVNMKQTFVTPSKGPDQLPQQTIAAEPQFQTNKEKECWHLYRKMCDKGVCVSFDTVLRGMLTPTEYRLRQREVSQDL